jgi:hypothetical protein
MLKNLALALEELAVLDPPARTLLLNDRFGDCASALGLGRMAVVAGREVVVNVRGRLKADVSAPVGVTFGSASFRIRFDEFVVEGDGYAQLESLLSAYESDGDGSYVWFVPDGYMAALSAVEQVWEKYGGGYFSHESLCVLNTANRSTRCRLEAFYEDTSRPSVSNDFEVAAKQSLHYRLDKLRASDDSPLIAKNAPTSYKLTSYDTRVIVQASRILTSGRSSEFGSFGTTMAWTPVG